VKSAISETRHWDIYEVGSDLIVVDCDSELWIRGWGGLSATSIKARGEHSVNCSNLVSPSKSRAQDSRIVFTSTRRATVLKGNILMIVANEYSIATIERIVP
jgi:hypothetical protein